MMVKPCLGDANLPKKDHKGQFQPGDYKTSFSIISKPLNKLKSVR